MVKIEIGKTYKFNTHNADSELNYLSGSNITIIRPLKDIEECDIAEVGNMYKVKFDNGKELDVFEDEIEE